MNEEIKNKLKMKIAISQIKDEEKKAMNKKEKLVFKNVGIAACVLMSLTGVVFAGNKVIEKVFKEPKKYESYNELIQDIKDSQPSEKITLEDEEKAISMEDAIIEANKFLNKFGYKSQEFVNKELKKNYWVSSEMIYFLTTNKNLNKGIHIAINAENGKCMAFSDNDLSLKKLSTDNLTKEEAENKANELYKMFNIKENEYKIKSIEEFPFYSNNELKHKEWNAMYYKDYDGALNQFERVEIRFAMVNGELILFDFYEGKENVEYKDNPIIISKEEAEKIALEQDKKLTDNDVDFVVTNLQIRQVNSWIYLLEQNGGKYPEFKQEQLEDGTIVTYPQYQTVQNRARKVWTVNIHYKKGEPDPNNEKKYNTKSIFVDVTTGEVIGGADESYWEEKD